MKEFKYIESKVIEGYQKIALKDRVTYDYSGEIKKEIKEAIEPADGYIIDLRDVETIDSTGLGLIVNTAKYFIVNHNKMVLINNNDWFDELFRIAKLCQLFEIYESEEMAVKALNVDDEEYWSRVKSF